MEIFIINQYGFNLMQEQEASSSFLAFDLETNLTRNVTGENVEGGRIITEQHLCPECLYNFTVLEKGRLRVALEGIPEEQEPITSITANNPLEQLALHPSYLWMLLLTLGLILILYTIHIFYRHFTAGAPWACRSPKEVHHPKTRQRMTKNE